MVQISKVVVTLNKAVLLPSKPPHACPIMNSKQWSPDPICQSVSLSCASDLPYH
uniref:Uncharacterized protein n=1 Tax=Picea glauca TaxID=3330 RepID=A0A101M1E4_PICGL|nr:hypothetical protein ABT39_MTgene3810 [Picea glauca]